MNGFKFRKYENMFGLHYEVYDCSNHINKTERSEKFSFE